jgi:hypothetical protein
MGFGKSQEAIGFIAEKTSGFRNHMDGRDGLNSAKALTDAGVYSLAMQQYELFRKHYPQSLHSVKATSTLLKPIIKSRNRSRPGNS